VPEEQPDPFAPAADHALLRSYAQERGVTDAVRHQDDLLGRRLPFADEVRALGERRLGLLAARRSELITEAEGSAEGAEYRHRLAAAQLDAARRALTAEGVPATERELPPLERSAIVRSLLIALAVAAATGVAVQALVLRSDAAAGWKVVVAITALLPAAALVTLTVREREAEPEPARLTALRRTATRAAVAASEAGAEAAAARDRMHGVAAQAAELAAAERALAAELLATYVSAAFGALAPGALADRAAFAAQADVVPPAPEWAG
jgi:hypothetical protein